MAPWQPMKPTWMRSVVGLRPSSRITAKSNPGEANPVHDTVTRWVIDFGDRPLSAIAFAAAGTASFGACSAYIAMRCAVVGPSGSCPGRNGEPDNRVPVRRSLTNGRPKTWKRVRTPDFA